MSTTANAQTTEPHSTPMNLSLSILQSDDKISRPRLTASQAEGCKIPIVPHKAVAEVKKEKDTYSGWQSKSTHGPKGARGLLSYKLPMFCQQVEDVLSDQPRVTV